MSRPALFVLAVLFGFGCHDAPTANLKRPDALTRDVTDVPSATWDGGGGDGHWSNPLNWVGDVMPAPGTPLVIENAGTVHVDVNTTVGAFRFGTPDLSVNPVADQLIIDPGVELVLSDNPADREATISLHETVVNNGTLTINDQVILGAGTFTNNGTIRIAGPANFDGGRLIQTHGLYAPGPYFQGNRFVNDGTIEVSGMLDFGSEATGPGSVTINNGTIVLMQGILRWKGESNDFGTDVSRYFDFYNSPTGMIRGIGSILLGQASPFGGVWYEVPFRNDGIVNVAPLTGSDVSLTTFTRIANNGSIGPDGKVSLNCQGDVYPRGELTAPISVVCHSWAGHGTTNSWSEALNWNGQVVPTSGTTTLLSFALDGKTASLDVTFVANGKINIIGSSILTIAANGHLTANGALTLSKRDVLATVTPTFDNSGTFIKASTGSLTGDGSIVNSGSFTTAAAFSVAGLVTNTGSFTNTGVIDRKGDFDNHGTIANSGTFINRGSFLNANALNSSNLFQNIAGTLTNSGTLTNTGRIESTDPFSTHAKITNTATGTINNSGSIDNQARSILVNDGAISNSGSIENQCLATFTNHGTVTGTPVAQKCGIWDGGGGDGRWSNPLNWVGDVVPAPGTPLVIENAGTVHVDVNTSIGAFRFGTPDPSVNPVADQLIIEPGVELVLSDNPADQQSTISLHETVVNNGTLTINDQVTLGAGTFTNNGTIRIGGPATLAGGRLIQTGGPYAAPSTYFGSRFVNDGMIECSGTLDFGGIDSSDDGAGVTINNGTIVLMHGILNWKGESNRFGTDVSRYFDFYNSPTGVIRGTGSVVLGGKSPLVGQFFDVPFRNDGTIDLAPRTSVDWIITNFTILKNGGSIGSSGNLINNGTVTALCNSTLRVPIVGAPAVQKPCNQAPVVTAGPNATVNEGVAMTLSGASFTDPDNPPHSGSITWGDGQSSSLSNIVPGALTASHAYADQGTYTVEICVTDQQASTGCDHFSATVLNVAPTATFQAPSAVSEGQSFSISLQAVRDVAADLPGIQYRFDCGNAFGLWSAKPSRSCVAVDYGSPSVRAEVRDKDGAVSSYSATLTIENLPPTVGVLTLPIAPIATGSAVAVSSDFTDPGIADTHTGTVQWDVGSVFGPALITESSGSGRVSASSTTLPPGVYTPTLRVTDNDGGVGQSTATTYVVVYDPSGGFVTGGGWIVSPTGAYTPNASLTGRASFGFVAKYGKGTNKPSGTTEFQFQTGGFSFSSTQYDWLVVAGARAQFKGLGTINGAGSYGFLLTAIDGQANGGRGVDALRIKIWRLNSDGSQGTVIYDNKLGSDEPSDDTTVLGGGSIVIHG